MEHRQRRIAIFAIVALLVTAGLIAAAYVYIRRREDATAGASQTTRAISAMSALAQHHHHGHGVGLSPAATFHELYSDNEMVSPAIEHARAAADIAEAKLLVSITSMSAEQLMGSAQKKSDIGRRTDAILQHLGVLETLTHREFEAVAAMCKHSTSASASEDLRSACNYYPPLLRWRLHVVQMNRMMLGMFKLLVQQAPDIGDELASHAFRCIVQALYPYTFDSASNQAPNSDGDTVSCLLHISATPIFALFENPAAWPAANRCLAVALGKLNTLSQASAEYQRILLVCLTFGISPMPGNAHMFSQLRYLNKISSSPTAAQRDMFARMGHLSLYATQTSSDANPNTSIVYGTLAGRLMLALGPHGYKSMTRALGASVTRHEAVDQIAKGMTHVHTTLGGGRQ